MVLGFGEIKVDLQVSKFNFKPGESIEGTVSIKLKKPKKAKGVFVSLYADQNMLFEALHKNFLERFI